MADFEQIVARGAQYLNDATSDCALLIFNPATDQIMLVVRSWLQRHQLRVVDRHLIPNETLCGSDRVDSLKLENDTMFVKPVVFQIQFERGLPFLLQGDGAEMLKPFGEIGENFCSNFSSVSLGLHNAGNSNTWGVLQTGLLQNLKCESFAKLHSCSAQDGAD